MEFVDTFGPGQVPSWLWILKSVDETHHCVYHTIRRQIHEMVGLTNFSFKY